MYQHVVTILLPCKWHLNMARYLFPDLPNKNSFLQSCREISGHTTHVGWAMILSTRFYEKKILHCTYLYIYIIMIMNVIITTSIYYVFIIIIRLCACQRFTTRIWSSDSLWLGPKDENKTKMCWTQSIGPSRGPSVGWRLTSTNLRMSSMTCSISG